MYQGCDIVHSLITHDISRMVCTCRKFTVAVFYTCGWFDANTAILAKRNGAVSALINRSKNEGTSRETTAERRLQTLIKCHSSATRFVSHPPTVRSLARIFAPLVSARSYVPRARVRIISRGGVENVFTVPGGTSALICRRKSGEGGIKGRDKSISCPLKCFSNLFNSVVSPLFLPLSLPLPVIVSPPPVIRCCCCTRDVAVLISTGLACLHVLSISVFLFFREIAEQKRREETDRSFRHFIG